MGRVTSSTMEIQNQDDHLVWIAHRHHHLRHGQIELQGWLHGPHT